MKKPDFFSIPATLPKNSYGFCIKFYGFLKNIWVFLWVFPKNMGEYGFSEKKMFIFSYFALKYVFSVILPKNVS